MIEDADIKRMWKYRKENLAIKVETENPSKRTYNQKSITFLLAGNGSQFSTITVYGFDELTAFAEVVNKAVRDF